MKVVREKKGRVPEIKRLVEGSAGGGFSTLVCGILNGKLERDENIALKPLPLVAAAVAAVVVAAALIAILLRV